MTATTQAISKKVATNIRAYVDNDFNYFDVQRQTNPDFVIKLSAIEKEGVSKFEVIQILDDGGKGNIQNGVLSLEQAEFLFNNHKELQKINSDYAAKRTKNLALENLSVTSLPSQTFEKWLKKTPTL